MGVRRPAVSDTELEVLKALWDHGPGTVRDINAVLRRRGRRWAYTTVQTLLGRLQAKGYVASDKAGLAHVYAAAVSRDKLLRLRLRELSDDLCKGTATPLVLALVEDRRWSAADLAQLRQLLDELDKKNSQSQ